MRSHSALGKGAIRTMPQLTVSPDWRANDPQSAIALMGHDCGLTPEASLKHLSIVIDRASSYSDLVTHVIKHRKDLQHRSVACEII